MRAISYTLKNFDKLKKKMEGVTDTVQDAAKKAVRDSIFLIHETAVNSIQDNSNGTLATRYSNGKPRKVLVSRPGDPPNTDTGRLVQSIKFDFQNGGLIGRVGTNLRYGAWLEFGTRDMAARPWLAPAVKSVGKNAARIFEDAVKATLKRVK